jgi:hypothetical protein
MKNIDLMIKDRRHSCNLGAAVCLGDITLCLLAQFW